MSHFDVSFTKEDIKRAWDQAEARQRIEMEKTRESMKPWMHLIDLIVWMVFSPIIYLMFHLFI